jgi:type IV pilus assembly protein PilQ
VQPRLTLRFLVLLLLSTGMLASHGAVTCMAATHRYTGQLISLDLHNADLGDVLRLLGAFSGLNIVAAADVKGTVTMRLIDVPWDQALDVMLQLHDLAYERQGNVILVAPRQQFLTWQQERLRARQLEAQAEAVLTHIVPIHYRDAAGLQETLQQHLGHCATISVDTRTNSLIITGPPSCLGQR